MLRLPRLDYGEQVMSHQPFETWLFEPDQLSRDQRARLEQHLIECVRCRQVGSSLRAVDQVLGSADVIGPMQGFSTRFAAALDREREWRRKRQTALVLTGTLLGSLIILAVLLVLGIPQLAGMGSEVLRSAVTGLRQVAVLTDLVLSLLETLDLTAYPLVMLWPALAIALSIMGTYTVFSVVWTALYLRLATQPIQRSRRL